MQHDHVLKKLNFDPLTPAQVQGRLGGVGGGLRAKYLLPFCCICDSLQFDMQYDHVMKRLNFDLWTPPPKSTQRVGQRLSIKNHV